MKFYDSKKFIEMLKHARSFIDVELSMDKNLPSDVEIFLEVLNELQRGAEKLVSDNDWIKFFLEYNEDIEEVLSFVQDISSGANKMPQK